MNPCFWPKSESKGTNSSADRVCCLAQCKEKPKGDKYGFTHFARSLNSGKGIAPLSSDSRRRADRYALEASAFAAYFSYLLY